MGGPTSPSAPDITPHTHPYPHLPAEMRPCRDPDGGCSLLRNSKRRRNSSKQAEDATGQPPVQLKAALRYPPSGASPEAKKRANADVPQSEPPAVMISLSTRGWTGAVRGREGIPWRLICPSLPGHSTESGERGSVERSASGRPSRSRLGGHSSWMVHRGPGARARRASVVSRAVASVISARAT